MARIIFNIFPLLLEVFITKYLDTVDGMLSFFTVDGSDYDMHPVWKQVHLINIVLMTFFNIIKPNPRKFCQSGYQTQFEQPGPVKWVVQYTNMVYAQTSQAIKGNTHPSSKLMEHLVLFGGLIEQIFIIVIHRYLRNIYVPNVVLWARVNCIYVIFWKLPLRYYTNEMANWYTHSTCSPWVH